MQRSLHLITLGLSLAVLNGCASLPHERAYAETSAYLTARRGISPDFDPANSTPSKPAQIPHGAISIDEALRLAFRYNPRIRQEYARLGLGGAELEQARRLANPSFGYDLKHSQRQPGAQIGRSLSLSIGDLLLLPARKRFATEELSRLQKVVAAELLDLATQVEIAWYAAVGTAQVAAMRELVAQAAERSSELAQRYFDAGNINRLQLDLEFAAAAQARIAAVRATAEQLRARSELAGLMGIPANAGWTLREKLAAPVRGAYSADELLELALAQRLDLAAGEQEVAQHQSALQTRQRWRWLGAVETGYEREHEFDGDVLRGPSLNLELPIFDQGQGALARAQSGLMDAQARRDALRYAVRSEVQLRLEQLQLHYEIVERYRSALVPRRESIVARSQEQVNFMLTGVFELILAKQQEYDAYQEYLQAARDYWTAHAELRRAVGGRLPDDDQALESTLGVDVLLPSTSPPAMDHSHGHGDSKHKDADPGDTKEEAKDDAASHHHGDQR